MPGRRSGMTAIYALRDSRGLVRYVGKAVVPSDRYHDHLRLKSGPHCSRWVASAVRSGGHVQMEVLEWCPDRIWEERERHWISFGKMHGWNLTNHNPGGVGMKPGPQPWQLRKVLSEETRRRISIASKGRVKSQRERERLSQSLMGHTITEETRAKISEANKGRRWSAEARMQMSTTRRGLKKSEEWKRKASARLKAFWADPKNREIRIAQTRAGFTTDVRMRISTNSRKPRRTKRGTKEPQVETPTSA